MSVVAVRVDRDEIVIAADSILCKWDAKKNNPKDFTKLNKINGMIVGGCGFAQELSMMWHYMGTHLPKSATEKDVLTFFVEFAKWKAEMGDGAIVQNTYIFCYDGHAFLAEGVFIHEIHEYEAIGAGENYANAALYLGHTPEEAVKVACDLCCFVSEPIVKYVMKKKGKDHSPSKP